MKHDTAAMAMLGLLPEDLDDGKADVWPENEAAVDAFLAMGTQWRMGPAGPIGMDYAAVPAVLALIDVPRADRKDTFECLRIMESEALAVMHEGRNG